MKESNRGRRLLLIDFGTSFGEFALATFFPLYLGMLSVIVLRQFGRVNIRYLSAFALGLLFWFFLDTLNSAIQLGVNEGYSFSFRHGALLLLFIFGFLSLLVGVGLLRKEDASVSQPSHPLFVALLIALGMVFHGIGEGLEFGALSSGTQALTILDAIGGYSGGVSYVLHKFLEATIVMIVFVALTSNEVVSLGKLGDLALIGVAFGIPSAVGQVVGYYVPVDASYFFALGGGATLLVALLVIRSLFNNNSGGELDYSHWIGVVFSLMLGFLCLYAAALFHSTV